MGSVLLGVLLFQGQVLRAQRNLDFKGFLPYAQRLSDVWGFEAADGTEYALVGVFDGLSIVSLADPENPTEVQFIPGPESIWRDIKTWEQRAYVVNETGGGLLIVDLRDLPGSVDTVGYSGGGLRTAHNIFIDEAGKAFLFGANLDNGGATILDLAPDPDAPIPYGAYRERYLHDGYARGDTLWGAEIFNGTFSVVDVSQPDTAFVLADQATPTGLTHATWLSDDGATLIAVEETGAGKVAAGAGKVAAYDVTDLSDINLESIYRSNWVDSVIPHNSFYRGDWVVNSVYFDGVTIIDATRPPPEQSGGNGALRHVPTPSCARLWRLLGRLSLFRIRADCGHRHRRRALYPGTELRAGGLPGRHRAGSGRSPAAFRRSRPPGPCSASLYHRLYRLLRHRYGRYRQPGCTRTRQWLRHRLFPGRHARGTSDRAGSRVKL
jgi:choice-of-anchor B domain-containing protein